MLALTRKKDEAIIIDGNIEIKVLEISGDKVKIGISAPKEVSVYREEVYKQIQESNKEAVMVNKSKMQELKALLTKGRSN